MFNHTCKNTGKKYIEILAAGFIEIALVILSSITGQLIHLSYSENLRDSNKYVWGKRFCNFVLLAIMTPLFLIINTTPAVFIMTSWITGSVNVFNVTFIFNVPKIADNSIPNIVMSTQSNDKHFLNDSKVIDNLIEFEAFSKLVILFIGVSSALSFLLFIYALVCTYKCDWLWTQCTAPEQRPLNARPDPMPRPLDPFQYKDRDNELNPTSTKIDLPESLYFIVLFVINIALWIACAVVFCAFHFYRQYYTDDDNKNFRSNPTWLEALGFGMYMYSLLCTIVSCFIFSKIAYSVTHRCLKLYDEFTEHRKQDDEDGDGLERLIRRDLQFTKMAQATIIHFEYWFTLHWIFYTVTSFLLIALFLDMVEFYMHSKFFSPTNLAIGFQDVELVIFALFTLQHCFLFLYPCFKAAAVTVSREKLIKKVNAYQGDNHPLTRERKQLYIQHLKNMKFGFRVSFFCARLRFGFNVAYISIFIGLLGVLLKLTGVF